MKRYVFALALAGVMASADGATAFYRPWCAPPPCLPYRYNFGPFGFPIYRPYFVPLYQVQPVPYYYQPYPAFVPQPGYQNLPPATVPKVQAPAVPSSPPIVTVIPSSPPSVKPESDPMVKPASGGIAAPMPAPAPLNTIPDPMVPKTPPLVLPPLPGSDAKPMLPPSPLPNAVPSPAPAPSGNDPLPPIPLPEPRKVQNSKDELPPLVLPPETPGGPSGVIPSTTVRSSPLTGAMKVQVFAVSGSTTGTLLRKIGFFNHTNRDLDLVIEGKAVRLPKKSYLHAELPAKFTWMHSDGAAEAATVPENAAGLDVLFKD